VNLDATLVLAKPKISPIAWEMRERLADMLNLDTKAVSIKAKTPEGLGLDHVAQAHATVLLEKVEDPEDLRSMSAMIASQRNLEDVVRDLLAEVHGTTPERQRVKVKVFDTEDIT
jgi:2-C-methyl-D-erythritol 2,4-cyclodiphosphate synthase